MRAYRWTSLITALLTASACGDDGTEPDLPDPVPSALRIAPSPVNLMIGTVQSLTVTVLDEKGQPMTSLPDGFAMAWTSSDSTRVSVDAMGRARGVRPGSATLVASAGTIQAEVAANVATPQLQLEAARSVSAEIGSEGGVIETTSSANVHYRLVIPPLALHEKTTITITPIAAVQNAPFLQLLGAVRFAPDGLHLLQPGRLTIELPTPPNLSKLVGIAFSDDGQRLALTPGQIAGNSVSVTVGHFSGAGAASVDTLAVAPADDSSESWAALRRLLEAGIAADAAGAPNVQLYTQIFRDWFRDEVKPALVAAAADFDRLDAALSLWRLWLSMITTTATAYDSDFGATLTLLLATELSEAESLAAAALRAFIDSAMATCLADMSPLAAYSALIYQSYAEAYGLNTVANGLDRAGFIQKLCLRVRHDQVTLPDTVLANQPAALSARVGLAYGSTAAASDFSHTLNVTISPNGSTDNTARLYTTSAGVVTTTLTPDGTTDLSAHLHSCMRPLEGIPGGTMLAGVCADTTISRSLASLVDLTGTWSLIVDDICPGTLTIDQSGLSFTVSGSVGGAPCPFSASGVGNGVLNGYQITFGIAFGSGWGGGGGGSGAVTFDGTVDPSGNSMSGTHSRGTWRATRQ
jgi:hypothetical protein